MTYAQRTVIISGSLMLLVVACVCYFWTGHPPPSMGQVDAAVIVQLQKDENFKAKPYRDTRDNLTIGWGTDLSEGITRTEAAYLLRERLADTRKRLAKAWAPFDAMPSHVQAALLNMGYQLGVGGVIEFHDMLAALERGDYAAARAAALESAWAHETPARARRVADALTVGRGYGAQ